VATTPGSLPLTSQTPPNQPEEPTGPGKPAPSDTGRPVIPTIDNQAPQSHQPRTHPPSQAARKIEVSTDIAVVNNGQRGVITAIRAGDETLKLGSWEVSDDGMTIRQLAEAQAGKASDIDIAIGRLIVTACRAANGNLFLISWEDRGGTIDRRNDSRDAAGHDRAGSASVINILALTEEIFVTAVRTGSGDLMLLTWRLESNGELTRIADSGSQAETVSEIALVRVDADPFGNPRVVTAVRAGDGTLLLISWKVSPDGSSIERLSHDHGQAGRADLIRAVTIDGGIIVTSMRAADGNLLLISWAIDSNGSITRRTDSHGLAGEIFSNAIMRNPVGVLSAVESGHGLLLIKWKITPQGGISRGADSDMQAGESSLITLAQERLGTAAQSCSVIKNGGGDLMLITWADE
jgi:hypothetical protein